MSQHRLATFWTGPASPYQTLCIGSWVAHGFDVTVYTADTDLVIPPGARQRPAREILDLGGHVHRYAQGFGAGSPSLHSNLFRYKLIQRGDWWLDADVILLRDSLPDSDWFMARLANGEVGCGIIHFPPDAPFGQIAFTEAEAIIATARWSQTGPTLATRIVRELGLEHGVAPRCTAYEIDHTEVMAFFDPEACEEVERRTSDSTFVHLWHEVWRSAGIPEEFGPPQGSYLDKLFNRHGGAERFKARLPIESLRRWIGNFDKILKLQEQKRKAGAPFTPTGPRF